MILQYNNINKNENIASSVQVTRTYILSKCVIDIDSGIIYTNINIPSINISSNIDGASGDYIKSEYGNYFISENKNYKAQYNFGKLYLIDIRTKTSILGQLNYINVICEDNNNVNGAYIKYNLNECRKSESNYILYNNKLVNDNSLYIGEYDYDVDDRLYKKGEYKLYKELGIWYLIVDKLYTCIDNNVTGLWDSTKWTVDTSITAYNKNSEYNIDSKVIYSGRLYKCKYNNVKGPWNSSKWIVDTSITTYNENSVYKKDDKVIYSGKLNSFNVKEKHTLETFNNFLSIQSNVTIRNSIYSHARLFNCDIDSVEEQSGSNNNTPYDYLNYCVSSNLNLHNNVILNIQRRKNFKYSEECTNYNYNYQIGDVWYEYHVGEENDEQLLDEYTRKDGTVITDYLIGLVQTVNGSVISNNNFLYLYTDNIYKKLDNISNDFYNLPQDVIDNEKSTGGSWYRAYDKFYSRTLFKQLNTYADYSKLMLNNGNIPYWDIRNGEGLFYESGVIVFECGYNETITNYTNRIIKFIESLPTNLNGCEITFVFKSYGDQENINLSSTIYFDNFYNGVIRIIGISQNKTNIISNDFTKPIFSFTNVDNVYIDNIKFDYNFYVGSTEVIESSSCTLEFENINNVELISTEVCNIFTYVDDPRSKKITSCGILANNSNVTISGLEVKRCYSALKGTNNSKFNVSGLNLSFDSINRTIHSSINNNWNYYYKYLIELQNNSIGYIKMDKYVVNKSQHFYWKVSPNETSKFIAANIERGSVLNHTHIGLTPYSNSDGGSIITPINDKTYATPSLNNLCNHRYNSNIFNANNYKFDNKTLDNLHFYRSVEFNYSQLPIGDIVEWLSINKYEDSIELWENELNMWPWGFYPCYEKYYPIFMRGKITTANGGEKKCINIPINGHDVNDYFYNVPLAVKMGYLINSDSIDDEDVQNCADYVKNFFAIPNFEPEYIKRVGEYFVRKIKIIKYSEKVEDRS